MRNARTAGFTMIEVMVSVLITAMLAMGVYQSLMVAKHTNHASGQRLAAFGLCRAKMEQVRGLDYDLISQARFPEEFDLRLAHLGGLGHVPVVCSRRTVIDTLISPPGKRIQVSVAWRFRDRHLAEQVTGVVYER